MGRTILIESSAGSYTARPPRMQLKKCFPSLFIALGHRGASASNPGSVTSRTFPVERSTTKVAKNDRSAMDQNETSTRGGYCAVPFDIADPAIRPMHCTTPSLSTSASGAALRASCVMGVVSSATRSVKPAIRMAAMDTCTIMGHSPLMTRYWRKDCSVSVWELLGVAKRTQ